MLERAGLDGGDRSVTSRRRARSDRERTPGGQRSAKRLAIFTSHPIQYQAPLFRALAASGGRRANGVLRIAPRRGRRNGRRVRRTRFEWDVPLLDGYRHEFLPNVAATPDVSRFRGVRLSRAR